MPVDRSVVVGAGLRGVRAVSGVVAALVLERLALLRLLPYAGRWLVTGLGAVFLLRGLMPAVSAVPVGIVVGRVVEVLSDGGRPAGVATLVGPLAALAGFLVLDQLASALAGPLRSRADWRIDGHLRRSVRLAALRCRDLGTLERAQVQDDLDLALDGYAGGTVGPAVTGQFLLCFRFLGAFAAAGVLATYAWWLAVAVFVVSATNRAILRREYVGPNGMRARVAGSQPLRRRADYYAEVVAGPAAAKEVRVFGLGGWFADRYQHQELARLRPLWRRRYEIMRQQWWILGLTATAALLPLAVLGQATARGTMTAGALAFYLQAARGVTALCSMGHEAFDLSLGVVALAAWRTVTGRLAEQSAVRASDDPVDGAPPDRRTAPADDPPESVSQPPLIRLDGVVFGYPNSGTPVLRGVDLEIRPGEKVAIVGLNGAGKTTLIKLLAGLYQPDAGRISVDGTELRQLDQRRWWRRLAVVFQDFVRYELPARDNVRLGAPDAAQTGTDCDPLDGDPAVRDAALARAAERVDVLDLIEGLPYGWDTVLSRGYANGTDLSGGQWQKVALARAMYALETGAQVLIVDEPTAHLDVRAELEIFDQILEATTGRTVLLISHRFSTVRHADRIVVLSDGRIAASGTHAELLAAGGAYANWFDLQASMLREADAGRKRPHREGEPDGFRVGGPAGSGEKAAR